MLIVKIAGIDANTACTMIMGLEAALNDELAGLICKSLGKPRICPHGYEIPEV